MKLDGKKKAAILMLALPEEATASIFEQLDNDEIKEVSKAMLELDSVNPSIIDAILNEFYDSLVKGSGLVGGINAAERLLTSILDDSKARAVLFEVKGGKGYSVWDHLSKYSVDFLFELLKNEQMQTCAFFISKLQNEKAAALIMRFGPKAPQVVEYMLNSNPVSEKICKALENILSNGMFLKETDLASGVVDGVVNIFNSLNPDSEKDIMSYLEKAHPDKAKVLKSKIFVFDDLCLLESAHMQLLIRSVSKDALALALKGSDDAFKKAVFDNMSQRAAKMLQESMVDLGEKKYKEIYEAQSVILQTAKAMIDRKEISKPDKSEGK